jgi:uncharacterized protein
MKTYFSDKEQAYDGTQLKSLYAYLNYKVQGDSVVSWVGPCNVSFEHMVDGEDFLAGSEIRGDKMVHFIVEKFNVNLFSGVALQRLMASIVIDYLREKSSVKNIVNHLRREGDDIYFEKQKLSISIATVSPTSTLVHFAVNVVNDGTPVSTLCLAELNIEPSRFAKDICERFAHECTNIESATQKVHWVK